MPSYEVTLNNKGLGDFAKFSIPVEDSGKPDQAAAEGTLARTLVPKNKNYEIDVVSDYKWTLSNVFDIDQMEEIPYIRLKEYRCLESSIQKQYSFYTQYSADVIGSSTNTGSKTKKGVLDDYENLWPRTNPSGFTYKFPYFNKTGQELASEPWQNLDSVGEALKNVAGGVSKLLPKGLREKLDKGVGIAESIVDVANFSMNAQYPSVGVVDRPKIFMAHNDRSMNISFTLYNTADERDWEINKDLIYLLMSQNLFNKRDFTTGIPPVFYEVYVPGQYYSYASCMTNFKVDHLGNQRLLRNKQDEEYIVPDAYQIDLTLSELVKPSKNQYEALITGEARKNVTTRTFR